MGSVFRATQLGLGRAVAVKVIRPDHAWSPWYRARFEREARVMAALDHHNAVKILDYGAEPGCSWLAMELLVGETLAAWLARGPLAEVTAARIGAAVADVLVTAHAMRLVHRDLKPENLFILDGEGPPDPERVRVVDFGIAFIEDAGDMGRLTRGDVVVGTPAYISPEVLTRRVVGPPADLYALGVILFEMVTGTTPFVGDAGQLQARQIYLAPPSIAATRGSAVDPRYQDLVDRLLRKDPEGRPSALETRTILRGIAAGADDIVDPERFARVLPLAAWQAETAPMAVDDTTTTTTPTLRLRSLVPLDDDARTALAAQGVRLETEGDDVDVVICGDADVARTWKARGRVVIGALPKGDVDGIAAFVRAGVDDVLVLPATPTALSRRVLRAR
jgi:serine/threonine-protein kinase